MQFRGDYYFLSNMYPSKIKIYGHTFECAESAFQAMKCPKKMGEFVYLNGYEARRLGKSVPLRADWEEVKLDIMAEIIEAKFKKGTGLGDKLVELIKKDIPIIEDNQWKDTYWGKYNGKGENHLGILLMKRGISLTSEIGEYVEAPEKVAKAIFEEHHGVFRGARLEDVEL